MVHIPVVMATDNRYIPLIVSLTSMLKNAEDDTFYDIYVLIDNDFTDESKHVVAECLEKYVDRCSLSFTNVGQVFDEVSTSIPHISRPTYYRLIIPDLLREEKCIYLDTDTVIMSDLQELFNSPLGNSYIAGVWHPGIVIYAWEEGIKRSTGLPDAGQYINAGVLLMNLEKMRQDNLVETFLELISRNLPTQDQDIINTACYGNITFLPFKYNVMPKLAEKSPEDYGRSYSVAELEEAWNSPCIIHYADAAKPWNNAKCVFMDFWWQFFKGTAVYEAAIGRFCRELIINIIYASEIGPVFTKKIPRMFDIAYERDYVIYGAGKRARDVIMYMKSRKILPSMIIVSEMGSNPYEIEGIAVKSIKDIGDKLHEKTIIVAVSESLQKEIIISLQQYDYRELLPISDSFLSY